MVCFFFFFPLLPSVFPSRVSPSSELILFLFLSYLCPPWQSCLIWISSSPYNRPAINKHVIVCSSRGGWDKAKQSFWGLFCYRSSIHLLHSTACALKLPCFHISLFPPYVHDVPKDNKYSFKFYLWHLMRDLGYKGPSWPKALFIISSPSHTCLFLKFFLNKLRNLIVA